MRIEPVTLYLHVYHSITWSTLVFVYDGIANSFLYDADCFVLRNKKTTCV